MIDRNERCGLRGAVRRCREGAVALLALAAMLHGLTARAADPAEEAFGAAAKFTVKIETTISLPLHPGDEAGVFSGAGFVVDADRGWIVTNAHVASRSPASIRMRLRGAAWVPAKRVYVDPYLDLAVIAPTDKGRLASTAAASLACGPVPPTGHAVGAFGHPWGLDFTGTRGIVAGDGEQYELGALLTDAPINNGNSGGPLISLATGMVVGLNTSALEGKGIQNLSFAISARFVCRILDLLRAGRDPSPPTRQIVYYADSGEAAALKVARNFMPAGFLGLRQADVIKSIVGEPGKIVRESDYVHATRGRLAHVELQVERDGREIVLAGKLPASERIVGKRALLASGVVFGRARAFDATEVNYAKVATCHVEAGSLGASAGFENCDAVETIDGQPATDLEQVHRMLETAAKANRPVAIGVKRLAGLKERSFFKYFELSLPVEDMRWVRVEDEPPDAK